MYFLISPKSHVFSELSSGRRSLPLPCVLLKLLKYQGHPSSKPEQFKHNSTLLNMKHSCAVLFLVDKILTDHV